MRRRRILLIAVGLLAFCCLGAVVSALFFPESDDIAEETATVQVADAETEPSATPEPAAPTDIPPTAVATATAAPTNTTRPTAVLATDAAVPTSKPTETAVPPTNTPSAEAESISGLGQLRELWEAEHTLSMEVGFLYAYEDEEFWVAYQNGRISRFERQYEQAFPLSEMRDLSQMFIPDDSEFIETYSPPGLPELVVDLYSSQLVAGLFEESAFIGGEVGQFIVLYNVFDGETMGYIIGLGNNP